MAVVPGGQIQAAGPRIWGVMDALPVLPHTHECPTILGTIRRIPLRYGDLKVQKYKQPMEVKTR
jgi:hypothetical protein